MAAPIDRSDLVKELQRLADELGDPPAVQDMDKKGAFSNCPYYREFGSWTAALETAGIATESISPPDLIEELRRLANELEKTPTARELKDHGKYSVSAYYRKFDSWNDALQAAELETNHNYNLTREGLIKALSSLAEELGYPPTREDISQFGRYSPNPYYRVFGSWNEALRAAR